MRCFNMAEFAELLKIWRHRQRTSADAKRIALAHVKDLQTRIEEMKRMLERFDGSLP